MRGFYSAHIGTTIDLSKQPSLPFFFFERSTKLTYGKVRWNNAGSIRRDEASGRGPAGVDKGGAMEDA